MSAVTDAVTDLPHASESAFIVRGKTSADAIRTSLQALLPTRHHPLLRQRFTLLDTFDRRIRRAGARLTRAGNNGASMVAWQSRHRGSHLLTARLKHALSFVWDLPEGPLQQVLAPVVGVRRLLPQAEAEQHGSLLEILDDQGKTVARVRIESGRARLPASRNGWRSLPMVITVNGLRGYDDAYDRLVPVIASRPGIELWPDGLDDLILDHLGAPERGLVSSFHVELSRSISADTGLRQIHLTLLGLLIANEPGLRANLDTEFLHDFRVAVRRTRSLLGQLKGVFPPDQVVRFAREFSWLGELTGPLRDMDVLHFTLKERRGDVPAADTRMLTGVLNKARQHEHARIVEALDSERYRQLLSEWRAFLERPALRAAAAPSAARPLADIVAHRAWRLSRRIASRADRLDAASPPDQLHDVRITAKKLRYLIDVTPGFYDAGDLERILAALKKLQRALGDANDAHVQEQRLLECGAALTAESGAASTLLAIGRLAEQSRQRGAQLREQVVEALQRFRASRTRSACRRAFRRPETMGRSQ